MLQQPRIRTVKPEFFRHEELQQLQGGEHGHLQPMLVFIALWGHCDRAGNFPWRPHHLKLDILPFMAFDIARTLELLREHGFIVKYEVEGQCYGNIPTYRKHQRIDGKSLYLPLKCPLAPGQDPAEFTPPSRKTSPDTSPDTSPVKQPVKSEVKLGREGKGREEIKDSGASARADVTTARALYPPEFEAIWAAKPERAGSNPKVDALHAYRGALKRGYSAEQMLAGVKRYTAFLTHTGKLGTPYVQRLVTFLGPNNQFMEPWSTEGVKVDKKPDNVLYQRGKAFS